MSIYPISGCGKPSKPRNAQPSMYQILSWPSQSQINSPNLEQVKQKIVTSECQCIGNQTNQIQAKTQNNQTVLNYCPYSKANIKKVQQRRQTKVIVESVYKENKSPQKASKSQQKTSLLKKNVNDENQDEQKAFSKTRLRPKSIKNCLYSYEPVSLKASRSKSNFLGLKQTKKVDKVIKKQEKELDEKTIEQRKQKLKQFQIFTRVLPNSAFTTYYGKPTFEAYGRGTSCQNLKSFNVMPHKGDNHPKHLESHYSALMKARNVKSKSYLPRNPVQEILPPYRENQQNEEDEARKFQLPLQKPDLIKSNRFAKILPQTNKKSSSQFQEQKKKTAQIKKVYTEPKRAKTAKAVKAVKAEKKTKKSKDGLKYMNQRQGLIDLLQQKKLKASQLAFKVTECYPLQIEAQQLQKSVVSKENCDDLRPAGKAIIRGDLVSDLLRSKLVLKQSN